MPIFSLLLITYISGIAQPFLMLVLYRKSMKDFFKDPTRLIISNVSINSAVDRKYLSRLSRYPLLRLELVALELKSEKDAFDKRISLVVGAISRVGLVPGLFALLLTWQKTSMSGGWLEIIAYSLPAFYIMGVWAHIHNLKLERISRVIDFAITDIKNRGAVSSTLSRLKERAKS